MKASNIFASLVALLSLVLTPLVDARYRAAYASGSDVGGDSAFSGCYCDEDPTDGLEGPAYDTFAQCECQACGRDCDIVVGPGMVMDPHLQSWKGEWFDYMGQCDLKLLHVPKFDGKHDIDIHVRTTIRYDYSYIEAAALRIGEDILEVGSWGTYALNGVEGALGHHGVPPIAGYPINHRQINKKNYLFEVAIGDNQNITLSTFKDWVSVRIMGGNEATFGAVSGLMGTYQGKMLARDGITDLHDNINALGQDWQVQVGEPMLFRTMREPQAPERCLLPNSQTKVAHRLGESVARDAAEKACSNLQGSAFSLCVHDVIVNGDLELAQSGTF